MDIAQAIGDIEAQVGRASPIQKFLLEAELSPARCVSGGNTALQEKIGHIPTDVQQKLGVGGIVAITIRSHYPALVGFGSGSQSRTCRYTSSEQTPCPPPSLTGIHPAHGQMRAVRHRDCCF